MAVIQIATTRRDQPHAKGHRCVVAELHVYLLRPVGDHPLFGARRIMEFRWDYDPDPDSLRRPRFIDVGLPDLGWR